MTIMVKLNTIIHFDLISHLNMNTFSKMSVSVAKFVVRIPNLIFFR